MKQILIVGLLVFFSAIACSQTKSIDDVKLVTKTDSVSYSIGLDIGKSFKMQEIDIEPEVLLSGILHAAADTSLLTEEQVKTVMIAFQNEMRNKQQNKMKIEADKNQAEADAFFAENKNKEGVISLPNGLQYKVITSGSGKSPKLSNTVKVHYAGRLLDGTEFDSSYKRGAPYETKLTSVVKGWTEILQLMKVGDKWEVYIPSELAYGPRGSQSIGPNAALIFVMELVSIN